MLKMYKLILTAVFFALALAFTPVAVQARSVTRVLEPGRVYTFTGLERRVISRITVAGTTRYEYAAFNNRGEATGFGVSSGQFSVTGDGFTQITPLARMSVTFDSSRLAVRHESGRALHRVSVNPHRSVIIQNNAQTALQVRNNRAAAFETVVNNALGDVHFMTRQSRLSALSVPVGGELVLTPHERALELYFPALWLAEGSVTVAHASNPAIFVFEAQQGVPFVLSHSGAAALTIEAEATPSGGHFSYDFIVRDRQGLATSHGETSASRISVQPHRPMTVFPQTDGELFMPFSASRGLSITPGTFAPAYMNLMPGESLEIANNDLFNAYAVHFSSVSADYPFLYNFTLRTNEGISFALEHSAASINLPPGATLTLTALAPPEWAPAGLNVRFAHSPSISVAPAAEPLTRITLEEGESVAFTNYCEDSLRILAASALFNAQIYYTLTDEHGESLSFGLRRVNAQEIAPGHTLHLTNQADTAIIFTFPVEWEGAALGIQLSEAAALYRRTLARGESTAITNHAEEAMRLRISSPAPTARLDYVLTDDDENITFGTRYARDLTLAPGESIHLTSTAQALITFPLAWKCDGLAVYYPEFAALERLRLAPLRSIMLNTDGESTLRINTETTQRNSSLDYTKTDLYNEITAFGVKYSEHFNLPQDKTLHLTNANEAAVVLVFPTIWREKGLRTQTIQAPALYRRYVPAGQALRFDNVNRNFNKPLQIEPADNAAAFAFDFLLTGRDSAILEFGTRPAGEFVMRHDSRLTVTCANGTGLYVAFPAIWHTRFIRIHPVAHPPLFHISMRPGETIILRNPTARAVTLTTNAQEGGAGFFTRAGAVQEAMPQPLPLPGHGNIVIPPGQFITITAARGATLNIWLPHSLARQLRWV